MTGVRVEAATPPAHVNAAPVVDAEGWAKVARWAIDGVAMLGVGLLVPVAILVVGTPIVLFVRLVLWIVGLL